MLKPSFHLRLLQLTIAAGKRPPPGATYHTGDMQTGEFLYYILQQYWEAEDDNEPGEWQDIPVEVELEITKKPNKSEQNLEICITEKTVVDYLKTTQAIKDFGG